MQGRTSLLVLQALLHVGLVLRGHHPLGGGLGVVDFRHSLVDLVTANSDLVSSLAGAVHPTL